MQNNNWILLTVDCKYSKPRFSIRNASITSQVESWKLTGVVDSCFIQFGTFQQCSPTNASYYFTTDVRSPLRISNSPNNELSCIVLYVTSMQRTCLALKITVSHQMINLMLILYIKWADYSNICGWVKFLLEFSQRNSSLTNIVVSLKLDEENETAFQCSSQFSALNNASWWRISQPKILIKSPTAYKNHYCQNNNDCIVFLFVTLR